MGTALRSSLSSGLSLPARTYSASIATLMAQVGLVGWWEAENIDTRHGFRWKPTFGNYELTPYRRYEPLVVTASHGGPAIQMGYGNSLYSSVERGAICAPESAELFGDGGFTVIMSFKPSASADTGGTVGGYLFAARNEQGANPELTVTPDNTDARLVVQSSDGRPRLYGLNGTTNAVVDLTTTPAWRVITAKADNANDTVSIRVNGTAVTSSAAATGSMPSHAGSRSPLFGVFNAASALPYYGQKSDIAIFDRPVDTAVLALFEARFASRRSITLT